MNRYYKWYVAATIATGIAALALAYAAKQEAAARPEGPFKLITTGDREMIATKLNKLEFVYLHDPKLACSNRVTAGIPSSAALVYLQVGKKTSSGLWNKHSTERIEDIPDSILDKAREMCGWYNS
jgi:hypothetical protein